MNQPVSPAPRLSLLLAVTMLLQVIGTANTLAIPVLTPTIPGATSLGIGWYMTLLYLGAMFGAVWAGNLIQRHGAMRASQAALVLQLAGVGLALGGNEWQRLVGAVLVGLGYGPLTPASSQVLSRFTPPGHVGLVFSIKQTGVPMAGLLAGLFLVPLASAAGWRAAIGLMLVVSVLGMVSAEWLRRRSGPRATTRDGRETREPWYAQLWQITRIPELRAAAALSFCFSFVQLSLSGYLLLYLHEEVGFGLVEAGLVFGAAQGAGVAGRLLWGRLGDVTGAPSTVLLVIALIMAGASILVGLATPSWPVAAIVLLSLVFGGTAIGWNGLFLAEVARLSPPGSVASFTGAILFYTYTGVVVGPTLFAQLSEPLGSLGASFIALALVPLAAAGILWRQRANRNAASRD